MQDQVAKFTSRGMSAECVGGYCSPALAEKITDGKVQLIYMSPETVLSCLTWREVFRNCHFQENLVCLAVDEAHLIDKWCVDCQAVLIWCVYSGACYHTYVSLYELI
jgi:superfamily II DNA helicase RecQ